MATGNKPKPLTLTQAAYAMRKIIMVGGICVVVIMVGRVFLEAAVAYWKATHPEPPPPPTAGFGLLPKIEFPPSATAPQAYKLEMPPAKLKPPADRAFVFFQPSKRASLLAVDKAKEQAQTLGFILEPDRISSETYRWRKTLPIPAILDYNIVTGTFLQRLDWQSDPAFLQGSRLPNEDQAIQLTRQTLSSVGLLQKDIATSSAKVTYLKATGSTYTNTVSLSEADFLQVDIFRLPINGQHAVVSDRPSKGIVRAILSGNPNKALQLVTLEYNYLPVNYQTVHTYYIITPQTAYQLLSQGKGYLAVSEGVSTAVIRNISLGYFDSSKQQQYLQPIYILEGDGGFVGYVPAVDPRFVVP